MNRRQVLLLLLFAGIVFVWLVVNTLESDSNMLNLFDEERSKALAKPREVIDMISLMFSSEEYLNRTNTTTRLYDYLRGYSLYGPLPSHISYSSNSSRKLAAQPVANETLCSKQLAWLMNTIDQAEMENEDGILAMKGKLGFQLVTFLESFGTMKPSVHEGTEADWQGSYAICIKANIDEAGIKPRYCTGHFRLKDWPETDIVYPNPRISIGLCLPQTCDSSSVFNATQRKSIEWLAKQSLNKYYRNNLIMDDLYCIPDEASPLRELSLGGKILLCVLGIWLSCVLIASFVYHNKSKQQSKYKNKPQIIYNPLTKKHEEQHLQEQPEETLFMTIVNCLSLRQTIKIFRTNRYEEILHKDQLAQNESELESLKKCSKNDTNNQEISAVNNILDMIENEEEQGAHRVDLRCLDCIKSIMAMLVVFGHGFVFAGIFAKTIYAKRDLTISEWPHLMLSLGRCVDTFFLIFGLLTSFTLLRKFSPKQLGNPLIWLSTNVHIFLRVGPVFFLSYFFTKFLGIHLGSGPNWDYGVESTSLMGLCQNEPWWLAIPYLSRLGSVAMVCNPPGWFIVDYVQIALFLPALVYLLYILPKYYQKFLLIGYLIAISCAHLYIRLASQEVVPSEAFTIFGGMVVLIVEKFHATGYMDTLTRFSSVAYGCLIGYFLHLYQVGVIQEWPKWLTRRSTIWLTVLAHVLIGLLPVLGHKMYIHSKQVASLEQFLIGNIVFYVLWVMLNSILLINATTVYKKAIFLRFMGNHFWHCFNKLGLCIFLLHFQIVIYGCTILDNGLYSGSTYDGLILAGFTASATLALSIFVHLFIDAPFSQLVLALQARYSKGTILHLNKNTVHSSNRRGQSQSNGYMGSSEVNGQNKDPTELSLVVAQN